MGRFRVQRLKSFALLRCSANIAPRKGDCRRTKNTSALRCVFSLVVLLVGIPVPVPDWNLPAYHVVRSCFWPRRTSVPKSVPEHFNKSRISHRRHRLLCGCRLVALLSAPAEKSASCSRLRIDERISPSTFFAPRECEC